MRNNMLLSMNKGTEGSDPFVPFYLRANVNKLIVITKFLAKKVNVISEMCQLKDILISFSDHGVGSCDHLLKIRFLTLKNANLFVFSSLNRNFALSLQKN